ncbi:MAG: hypothetical protein AAGI23_03835 [Bacteroidota bacterium]
MLGLPTKTLVLVTLIFLLPLLDSCGCGDFEPQDVCYSIASIDVDTYRNPDSTDAFGFVPVEDFFILLKPEFSEQRFCKIDWNWGGQLYANDCYYEYEYIYENRITNISIRNEQSLNADLPAFSDLKTFARLSLEGCNDLLGNCITYPNDENTTIEDVMNTITAIQIERSEGAVPFGGYMALSFSDMGEIVPGDYSFTIKIEFEEQPSLAYVTKPVKLK